MKFPWTSRALLEAAETRTREAQEESAFCKRCLESSESAAEKHVTQVLAELAASHEDNKLLLDRIVQLSGQPPIFHPAPISATPTPETAKVSTIPAPETRVSFADVHRAAKKAIKNGDLNILSGAK